MTHRATIDATFPAGSMLQVFEFQKPITLLSEHWMLRLKSTVAKRFLDKIVLKIVSCNMD